MNRAFITNVATNCDVSVAGRTLKPGKGAEFDEEVANRPGVIAYTRKGFLKVEMVKESPDGVLAGVAPEQPAAVNMTPIANDAQPASPSAAEQPPAHTHTKKKKVTPPPDAGV